MRYQSKIILLISFLASVMACQDPIFWTQENEARTMTNNLVKNARIPDVDIDGKYLYAIVGGILYRRERVGREWTEYSLPQQAHSLDVDGGLIALTDGVFHYNFTTMTLGERHSLHGTAGRAFIDKENNIIVRYERDATTNNPMDIFYIGSNRYVGRYLGMIDGHVVSNVGVFSPGSTTPVNAGAWRDPRGTDGTWLSANSVVGTITGNDFSAQRVDGITGVAVISNTAAFNVAAGVGEADTIALVSVGSGGYREIFQHIDGRFLSRQPISSVNDTNIYMVSDLNGANISRFFYKNGILFALTSNAGLWTQDAQSGVWVWE